MYYMYNKLAVFILCSWLKKSVCFGLSTFPQNPHSTLRTFSLVNRQYSVFDVCYTSKELITWLCIITFFLQSADQTHYQYLIHLIYIYKIIYNSKFSTPLYNTYPHYSWPTHAVPSTDYYHTQRCVPCTYNSSVTTFCSPCIMVMKTLINQQLHY